MTISEFSFGDKGTSIADIIVVYGLYSELKEMIAFSLRLVKIKM